MIPNNFRRTCVNVLNSRAHVIIPKRFVHVYGRKFLDFRLKRLGGGRRTTWEIQAVTQDTREKSQTQSPNEGEKSAEILTTVPRLWLRDNCQCQTCINPDTKQRQFDTFEYSTNIPIDDCVIDGSVLKVTWRGDHKSEYNIDWLKNAFNVQERLPELQGYVKPIWWGSANVKSNPPEVKYNQVMQTDEGMKKWMKKIREYGFCFVDGCPATPEATKALLERIGPIRETHYGGFYDFTSDLSSKDTAYTSLALDVHTDTTYFTEPAGLQMFHILSHTEGEGGSTQLVDGFRAAHILQEVDTGAVDMLTMVKMMAHASGNDGISIQPNAPFSVLRFCDITGNLEQVRWNNADRGAFVPEVISQVTGWYKAARTWNTLVNTVRKDVRYEVQLVPGRPLIFDNWRVLHGRSAFTGKRRMSGGYINRDDFISRYRITNSGQEQIRQNGTY